MFRLSKFADYGMVIMTRLARHPERQFSASDLAEASLVPQPMASKILKALTRAGLLVSHRGAKGGYGLARASDSISVADVVTALDGPIALTACIEDGPGGCDLEALCPASANWRRINGAIREALESIPMSEMAGTIPPAFAAMPQMDASRAHDREGGYGGVPPRG